MLYRAEQISEILRHELQPSFLEVIDESQQHIGHAGANERGWGSHMRIRISREKQFGQSRVQAHRAIYAILNQHQAMTMHALSIELIN